MEEFIESKIKGNIAETIVEEMLRKLGFYVLKFGQEYIANPIIQLKQFIRECGGNFDFEADMEEKSMLKKLPDFVIIDKRGKIRFLEVKYRWNAQVREDIIETYLHYPNCALLIVNSCVDDSLAVNNSGYVNLPLDDKRKSELNKTRFHIWLGGDSEIFQKSENDDNKGSEEIEFEFEFETDTLPLSEWLKLEFEIVNNELISKYELLVEKWLKIIPNNKTT